MAATDGGAWHDRGGYFHLESSYCYQRRPGKGMKYHMPIGTAEESQGRPGKAGECQILRKKVKEGQILRKKARKEKEISKNIRRQGDG
ncbi:hypothetical protein Hamer_G011307 [Homarus americanus]|uniref:Uncharacterized protein n=1 Tax=Homarus americanus TaxID=6706 RepID=A0A8J5MP50_HOMAM|nr:hypothetical protein Hamer_G011307 [Homarus americanus]